MHIDTVRPVRRIMLALAVLLGLATAALIASPASADTVPGPKTLVTSRVVLERTGGFTGQPLTIIVDAGNPHPDVPLLFRAAASPAFQELRPSYLPKDTCCDFFFYKVTVTYTNDAKKSVVTMEGADAPAVLWTVINLTLGIGGDGAIA